MAHFAEIDIANRVVRVIVVHDSLEATGAEWCAQQYGGRWVQCSYNANGNPAKRFNFPGPGYWYDEENDAFTAPQPFPSWTLDPQTAQWKPPVPMPTDGMYTWDEEAQAWTQIGTP